MCTSYSTSRQTPDSTQQKTKARIRIETIGPCTGTQLIALAAHVLVFQHSSLLDIDEEIIF